MKYKLLDLFCGAGGAAMGYHRAGFEIVGVDIKFQSHYPFEFIQADAFTLPIEYLREFDVIHASPPCQRYSFGTPNKSKHPDLLAKTRNLLNSSYIAWIIENVPGAPIKADIVICGWMVGLPLIKRKRLFETSFPIYNLNPSNNHHGPVITVTGHGNTSGNRKTWGRDFSASEMKKAMGIEWMNRDELSQAIPPAYTEWIGKQLIKYLDCR